MNKFSKLAGHKSLPFYSPAVNQARINQENSFISTNIKMNNVPKN